MLINMVILRIYEFYDFHEFHDFQLDMLLFFLFEGCLCQFFLNCSSQKYLTVRKMYELLKYNNLKLSFHLCKSWFTCTLSLTVLVLFAVIRWVKQHSPVLLEEADICGSKYIVTENTLYTCITVNMFHT